MQVATEGVTAGFIWLAATAGALSLLTPCVFPMVPITVSYFLGRDGSKRASRASIATFGIGIVGTFTILGVVLALLVGAAGLAHFAANPWVNLALAAIFIALALNMLGLWYVRLPQSWLGKVDAASRDEKRGGLAAALLMGMLFTLTSFTCTAPFIGTLLVAAASGAWTRAVVGMFVYAVVFAAPFVILAALPSTMSRLPRSGAWLARLKATMGFVELAAAAKFISNTDLVLGWGIFTRTVVLGIWVAIAVVAAAYLAGMFRMPHDPPVERSSSPARVLPAFAFLAVAAWLAFGMTGQSLGTLESFLPPADPARSGFSAGSAAEPVWRLNDIRKSLAVAKSSNRRVFIDFTGYTCTNCRWMEANIFTRDDVRSELNRFELARLYTDGDGDMYDRQQALQQRSFGTVALPLYAIVDGDGRTVATYAGLTRKPAEFIAFLEKGLSAPPNAASPPLNPADTSRGPLSVQLGL